MNRTVPRWRAFPALVVLALTVFITGCAGSAPAPMDGADGATEPTDAQSLATWTAYGKLAVRDRNGADTANLTWHQNGDLTEVTLSGPLGAGATRLHSDDGSTLTVERNNESRTIDISSREAIIANTGWDLPLQALPFWMRGVAFPQAAIDSSEATPQGSGLALLEQAGWEVRYESYGTFDGLRLPTRLRLQRDDTQAKLLIRRWQTSDR